MYKSMLWEFTGNSILLEVSTHKNEQRYYILLPHLQDKAMQLDKLNNQSQVNVGALVVG